MVTVTVPATSANVGAGFDSLGLAVSMHNVFTFEESDRIQISSVDGTHVPAGSNNLVYRSARVVYDQLGIPLKGLRITQRNDIPMARGLGSSSACIVAGIMGANALLGEKLVHPNDHVNKSQSSNDTFPTAMHIAALTAAEDHVLPALDGLAATFERLSAEYADVIKVGRTHLQDATPLTLGQEISGWSSSLRRDERMIRGAMEGVCELALGGTAVGTGLNAPDGFDRAVAAAIAELTGKPFVTASNKFHALTSKDELVFAHGAVKALACDMMKIANDVRWLASGPRCGLGEIFIPENEPGSSIMPGKVNPTQCEAVTMVAVQVMGNDVAVSMAASQGNFELNVFMPVCIYNFLQSVRLLSESIMSFNNNCAVGIRANREKMSYNLHNSLMLVTALNPYIGYENAAKTAKKAYRDNISLREACVQLGFLTEEKFDEVFHPEKMV